MRARIVDREDFVADSCQAEIFAIDVYLHRLAILHC